MKKRYLKTRPVCKVTFELPGEATATARKVSLVGDFNNWDVETLPMKQRKDGSYSVTIALERNHEYQFRYLLDDGRWENDWKADKYTPTPYGDGENSVVIV